MAKIQGTQTLDPDLVYFVAEYLYRTAGFDRGLEYINTLNCEEPRETYYVVKVVFLLQHERANELEDYIQELTPWKLDDPRFQLLCLKYHLGLGQLQQAESSLSNIITYHPRSRLIIEAITLATIYNLDLDRTGFTQKVLWSNIFLALQERIMGAAEGDAPPVVHCLNLDRSRQRMDRCTDLYRDKTELRRVPGVPGDALPDYLLSRITINSIIPKSAVGCSLSHIAAWERIAENNDSTHPHIIVEDDGLPLWVNRATYGMVQTLMERQEFDLLYIHNAASPLEFTIREFSRAWKPEALPFQTGLERFMQHKWNDLPVGWGLYGYCLSTNGAQKLLALLKRDGLTNHIDWQTFLYSATDWNHPVVRTKENVAIHYQTTTRRAPQRELNSGILNFPMIAHIDFYQSTR